MRSIFILLVAAFALPVFAQEAKPVEGGDRDAAKWSKLGATVEGPRGFTLSSLGIRLNKTGQYEMWVKIVPNDIPVFVRRYDLPKGTQFVHQYATVDCEKKLLLLERTMAFDASHRTLEGRVSGITPSSRKDAVKPGSIGEVLFKYVCTEPGPLTKNEQP
ncbi:MAG: hypothetical protein IT174_02925 [Acidobacteria bacterium]|nr:hypothetical protein [Acidobacteriota bacterium]